MWSVADQTASYQHNPVRNSGKISIGSNVTNKPPIIPKRSIFNSTVGQPISTKNSTSFGAPYPITNNSQLAHQALLQVGNIPLIVRQPAPLSIIYSGMNTGLNSNRSKINSTSQSMNLFKSRVQGATPDANGRSLKKIRASY